MTLTPGKLWGLRRMADARGIFKMTAVDQRPPIKGPIAAHLGVEQAPWDQVARFKGMLVEDFTGAIDRNASGPALCHSPRHRDAFATQRG